MEEKKDDEDSDEGYTSQKFKVFPQRTEVHRGTWITVEVLAHQWEEHFKQRYVTYVMSVNCTCRCSLDTRCHGVIFIHKQ